MTASKPTPNPVIPAYPLPPGTPTVIPAGPFTVILAQAGIPTIPVIPAQAGIWRRNPPLR